MWVGVIYFVHPSFIAFFTSLHSIYNITMETYVSQSWKLTDNYIYLSGLPFCLVNVSVPNEMKEKENAFEKSCTTFTEFELRTRSRVFTLYSESKNNIVTCINDFRRGFVSVSRFIGHAPSGTTIDYNTFNLTTTITLRNYEQ
jgi:hypothetical protein